MNRGIFIIAIVSIFVTLANVFAGGIFNVLLCFDTCPSVASFLTSAPLALLIPLLILGPALALNLVAWIWELIELRRMGARGTLIFAAFIPLIALAAIIAGAALDAARGGLAPLAFTPLNFWMGEFALVLWPLLVGIIAFIYRQRGAGSPVQAPLQTDGPGGHA